MAEEIRFQTGFRGAATGEPGLVMHLDGSLWVVAPDGTETPFGGGLNILSRFAILFTETTGGGTYRGSVDVPPGTSILDVAVFCLAGPWQAAVATLHVGDEFHPGNGYIHDIDLVNVFNVPYSNESPDHGHDWTDTNVAGGVYEHAANWYAAGNAVYTPTVRYPNGATITATVIATAGGPIVALNTDPPDGSGGIGYAPGDVITVVQGTANTARYLVDTVDGGGAVLTYHQTDPGDGYYPATGVNTTTDGAGEFLQFNITDVDEQPVTDPGIVVVDVIGFGVPAGSMDAVKS